MTRQIKAADYDEIVDGYNAAFLEKQYNQAILSKKPYLLIYMNLKHFRYINLKYGYEEGNLVLQLLYHKTQEFLGDRGIIAHLYADHFGILVTYEHLETFLYKEWLELIDPCLYRIERPSIYRETFFSFGFYELKEDQPIAYLDALNLANIARTGTEHLHGRSTNIELYDETYYQHYMDLHELEIKTANAYKDYEFVPFLQPKVDAKTGHIVGAEALLRWKDVHGDYVPVPSFLPILNENGYIALVDIDTFDIICQMLQENLKNGLPVVPVSFNISKSLFYDNRIIQEYMEIFHKYDIPKELIEFELMESISLDDTKRMKEVINDFKEQGFNCCLDDFGNGYSSFNVLLNAELSAVKMDRQFFLDNLNGDSKLIIKTVIQLIKSLHMKVVAEGVETKEHVEYLVECGCDMIQGFYFYKPMPIAEFNTVLQQQRTL